MIKRFDLYGYYPEKKVRYSKGKGRLDEVLIPSYKELVDKYRNLLEKTGLKKSTIYGDVFIARKFLNYLQDAGIMSLKDTKETVVHELFLTCVSSYRGYDFSFGVRRFMTKMEYAIGKKLSSRIMSYLPKSAKIHKPYDAITIDEMDKLKGVLADDSLGFSFRDRAIMTVAMYTGLRRSDIVNLRLDNIDWENDRIRINQGKTGNPVTLPLRPVVGNAIYDYIVNERPKVDLPYIFLTDEPNNPRKRKMSPSVLAKMSYKFFDAAGIRMNGENRGFHMFRHHMATALLNKGYETPIIMSVLGHTAPLAVDYYLESDYNQLKGCGIDVSQWNRGKETVL
jgi:integrase